MTEYRCECLQCDPFDGAPIPCENIMNYTYRCEAGVEFEHEARITDPALTECPVCSKCTPRRLISAAAPALLKGRGWAVDGYAAPESYRKFEARTGRKPIGQ